MTSAPSSSRKHLLKFCARACPANPTAANMPNLNMKFFNLVSVVLFGLQLNAASAFVAPLTTSARSWNGNMQNTVGSNTALGATETTNESGLKKLIISSGEAEAEIFTLGACVTSFKVANYDYLFLRPDAKMDGSKPISGGLPHCFPQFGPGEIQQHGFARNLEWDVVDTTDSSVSLKLANNDQTTAMWPHTFEFFYKVQLNGPTLETEVEVTNTGGGAFDFQAALHSYFRCSDINKVTISSPKLDGASCLDRMKDPPVTKTFSGSKMAISEPTDQIFNGLSGDLVIDDTGNGHKLTVSNLEGWCDTVVWNPYGDAGMGADNFVCVESAKVQIGNLKAGEKWTGKMKLLAA